MKVGIKLTSGKDTWSMTLDKKDLIPYNKFNINFMIFIRPLTYDLDDIDNYQNHFSYDFIDDLVREKNPPKFLLTNEQVLVETIIF